MHRTGGTFRDPDFPDRRLPRGIRRGAQSDQPDGWRHRGAEPALRSDRLYHQPTHHAEHGCGRRQGTGLRCQDRTLVSAGQRQYKRCVLCQCRRVELLCRVGRFHRAAIRYQSDRRLGRVAASVFQRNGKRPVGCAVFKEFGPCNLFHRLGHGLEQR